MRRLLAAGVLAAGVIGLVAAVQGLSGRGQAAGTPSQPAPTSPPVATGEPVPAVTSTEPPTPTTGAPRVPTPADPARVLLVGDSEAQGLEPFLRTVLEADSLTTLTTDGRNSTGLVRSDVFDWHAHLVQTLPESAPDIVVAFFGGNDGQPFIDRQANPVDSPEWRAEYGARVGAVMDLVRSAGRTLIWIGVPIPGDADLRARLTVQNAVVTEQAAARPDVVFIDTWTLSAGIDGDYAPLVLDPLSGTYRAIRAERDEFHLNTAGAKILAASVGHAISDDLVRRGATQAGASAPTTVDPMGPGTYEIVANDSLSGIAAKTGTTVGAIVAANGWADQNHVIQVGQQINLPPKA